VQLLQGLRAMPLNVTRNPVRPNTNKTGEQAASCNHYQPFNFDDFT
jgi:hypothetical protein